MEKPPSLTIPPKSPSPASSDEGDELKGPPMSATLPPSESPKNLPSLLSIQPSSGSPNDDTEVYMYGKNLDESTMRHAVLLIDDYTVGNYKWKVSPGSWAEEPTATHRISFKIPPKKENSSSDQIWIDIETMGYGRLHCPTPFFYQKVEKPPSVPPAKLPQSGFTRNSSIRLSDNRVRRSLRKPTEGKSV